MNAKIEAIPASLRESGRLLVWKEITDSNAHKRKTPISNSGIAVGYNNPEAILPFEEARKILEKTSDLGLGISLMDGVEISADDKNGYLYSMDFDGFAEFHSKRIDDGVSDFLERYPSYAEISPSGTGFKYFFISDSIPETKSKIKFGVSKFLEKYPEIKKYKDREIEVFSKNSFLTLTGAVFRHNSTKLNFFESTVLQEIYEYLHEWAILTGGTGRTQRSKIDQNSQATREQKVYSKLTAGSLELVLAHIDHIDEQIWTDTSNALARAYGEEGLPYFLSYSAGEYHSTVYEFFDETECIDRFQRSLDELHTRPSGFGVKHLIDEAQKNKNWPHSSLEYEPDTDFAPFVWAAAQNHDEQEPLEIIRHDYYRFLTASELQNLPKTDWRVKNLFPEHGLGSIYGPSGSGKSFLALDLMAAVACGSAFYGHKTTQCPVVYVALEGTGGIAKRVEAYETHHKIKLPNTFRIVTDMLSLFSSEASIFAEAVIEEGLNEGVIVIDTLAQSAPGSDENSSAHMGMIISNAQLLQRMTNGLVVLIHHTGKDASRGARGHSSLYAALDAALEVKRTQGGLEWLSAKVKDGASGNATPFRLERVVLGQDEDGDEISSCVAVGDLFRKAPLAQPKGKNQKAVLDALLLKFGAGTTVASDEAHDIAKAALTGQTTNTAQRAKEALEGLIEIGRLVLAGEKYALV